MMAICNTNLTMPRCNRMRSLIKGQVCSAIPTANTGPHAHIGRGGGHSEGAWRRPQLTRQPPQPPRQLAHRAPAGWSSLGCLQGAPGALDHRARSATGLLFVDMARPEGATAGGCSRRLVLESALDTGNTPTCVQESALPPTWSSARTVFITGTALNPPGPLGRRPGVLNPHRRGIENHTAQEEHINQVQSLLLTPEDPHRCIVHWRCGGSGLAAGWASVRIQVALNFAKSGIALKNRRTRCNRRFSTI